MCHQRSAAASNSFQLLDVEMGLSLDWALCYVRESCCNTKEFEQKIFVKERNYRIQHTGKDVDHHWVQ
jgi:hypothetical protein